MPNLLAKSFDTADEVRSPDKTRLDVVDLGGPKAARLTLQPGWKWSECIKPVVGGDSCQARHIGYVESGRMHVAHDDGSEAEIGAGGVYRIEPGHNAWVVGDETFVGFEFESGTVETYAKPT
ncbi:MAG: cupin domain-containing protein [Actinomycetota bacterium]